MRLMAILGLTVALFTGGAFAETRSFPPSWPPPDEIRLELRAEGWVETETARVAVAMDAALTAEEAGEARSRILDSLEDLASDVEWRIIVFDRVQDDAGLERWRVEAEARVPEVMLGGLHERAEELSRPGQRLRIAGIDFTPTLDEREAVLAELRADIYRQTQEELNRLHEVYADRDYRVGHVDFTGARILPRPAGMAETLQRSALPAMDAGDEAVSPVAVAQRLELRAGVVLTAPDPALERSEPPRQRRQPNGRR